MYIHILLNCKIQYWITFLHIIANRSYLRHTHWGSAMAESNDCNWQKNLRFSLFWREVSNCMRCREWVQVSFFVVAMDWFWPSVIPLPFYSFIWQVLENLLISPTSVVPHRFRLFEPILFALKWTCNSHLQINASDVVSILFWGGCLLFSTNQQVHPASTDSSQMNETSPTEPGRGRSWTTGLAGISELGPKFEAKRKQPIIPWNSRARSCAGEEDRVTWLDLRPG